MRAFGYVCSLSKRVGYVPEIMLICIMVCGLQFASGLCRAWTSNGTNLTFTLEAELRNRIDGLHRRTIRFHPQLVNLVNNVMNFKSMHDNALLLDTSLWHPMLELLLYCRFCSAVVVVVIDLWLKMDRPGIALLKYHFPNGENSQFIVLSEFES